MKGLVRKWLEHRYPVDRFPPSKVAVMVPLPVPDLREDERISLGQLRKHLDGYEKFLLVPKGMHGSMPGFQRMELNRRYFGSAANHNRLLFTLAFWNRFRDFEYVLMYHLDALVFRDELLEWCGSGIDYIGAPWVRSEQTPWVEVERCGNGGFALYRIPSVMEVLINRMVEKPELLLVDRFAGWLDKLRKQLVSFRDRASDRVGSGIRTRINLWIHKLEYVEVNKRPNDYFWAMDAVRYKPDFRVGSLEEGLRFAFEADPEGCLHRNEGRLPFGAHAWERYDKGFWSRVLTGDGETGVASNP